MRLYTRFSAKELDIYQIEIVYQNRPLLCQLIDMSLNGICVSNEEIEYSKLDEEFPFSLLLAGGRVIKGILAPVHLLSQNRIGLKVISIDLGRVDFEELLVTAQLAKQKSVVKEDEFWKKPNSYFSAQLNDRSNKNTFALFGALYNEIYDYLREREMEPALMPTNTFKYSYQMQMEYLMRLSKKSLFYLTPYNDRSNQYFYLKIEMESDLDKIMEFGDKFIRDITKRLMTKHESVFKSLIGSKRMTSIEDFLDQKHTKIKYQDAIESLGDVKSYFRESLEGIDIISVKGKKELLAREDGALWITDQPFGVSSFTDAYTSENKKFTKSARLFYDIGEMLVCGERHMDANSVFDAISRKNINYADMEWYLRLKSEFPMKTAGIGIGLERLIAFYLNSPSLKNITLIPRLGE